MGVLLCLSDARLLQALSRKELSECIRNLFLDERHLFVRDRHIILCEAHILRVDPLPSCKSCKRIVTESPCDLSCPVWTEVKEDNRIILFYSRHWSAVFHHYDR